MLLVDDPTRAELILSNLRQVEPERPVLAVIEDIGAMLGDGREERLLSLLDGKTQIDHVLFIATTNYPEKLDHRLQGRPSRFDRVEVIRAPSAQVRRAYLEKRVPDLGGAETGTLGRVIQGFSIAHLKELILTVRCLGGELRETAARLKAGLQTRHTSESFAGSRMGFGQASR